MEGRVAHLAPLLSISALRAMSAARATPLSAGLRIEVLRFW
jgi:hypothetical protein